MKIDYQALESW